MRTRLVLLFTLLQPERGMWVPCLFSDPLYRAIHVVPESPSLLPLPSSLHRITAPSNEHAQENKTYFSKVGEGRKGGRKKQCLSPGSGWSQILEAINLSTSKHFLPIRVCMWCTASACSFRICCVSFPVIIE